MISGEFPDIDNHHRMYLGRRHWERILDIDPRDEVQINRKLFPWSEPALVTRSVTNVLAERAIKFAILVSSSAYTVNDYLKSLKIFDEKRFVGYGNPGTDISKVDHEYWNFSGSWERYKGYMQDSGYSAGFPNWHKHPDFPSEHISDAEKKDILNFWLLTESEIPDVLLASPDVLTERLREIVSLRPDNIRERLKARTPRLARLHNKPYFGIFEQEIDNPQAS